MFSTIPGNNYRNEDIKFFIANRLVPTFDELITLCANNMGGNNEEKCHISTSDISEEWRKKEGIKKQALIHVNYKFSTGIKTIDEIAALLGIDGEDKRPNIPYFEENFTENPDIGRNMLFHTKRVEGLNEFNSLHNQIGYHGCKTSVIQVKTGEMKINEENVRDMLIKYEKLSNYNLKEQNSIVYMRNNCFGKGTKNNKEFNKVIKSLEEKGLVTVHMTARGHIHCIENHLEPINFIADTYGEKAIKEMGKKGLLKDIYTGSAMEKTAFELYRFDFSKTLQLNLIKDNERYYFQIEPYHGQWRRDIMKEMGLWEGFKQTIQTRLIEKLNEIEEYLGYKIAKEDKDKIIKEGFAKGKGFATLSFKWLKKEDTPLN